MANQSNRLSYVLGKGGFLRLLYKPSIASDQMNLIALPSGSYEVENEAAQENLTESDSLGHYMAETVPMHSIRVDLRRRYGSLAIEALGLRARSMIDVVVVDIGASGLCDVYVHMGIGSYNRGNPQLQAVREGFSLNGGYAVSKGIAVPAWALPVTASLPLDAGYIRTGVTVSGITGI